MTDRSLIVAFLNARYDEDAQIAHDGDDARWRIEDCDSKGSKYHDRFNPSSALCDIESKRRILSEMIPIIEELDEIAYGEGQGSVPYGEPVARLLKLLALPHADHDDYAAALATVTS